MARKAIGIGHGSWTVDWPEVGDPLAIGAITATSAGATSVTLSAPEATGGTAPYTYQWHRSTSSGFTPSGGTEISGATTRSETDTGLTESTTYYYKLVVTDDVSDTVTSDQDSATPTGSSEPTPDWSWDPENYADFDAMLAEIPSGTVRYVHPNQDGDGFVSLPTGTIYTGGTGKYVRCQHPGGGTYAFRGVDTGPSVGLNHIFFRLWVRMVNWGTCDDDKGAFFMQSKPGIGGEVDRWAWYPKNDSAWYFERNSGQKFYTNASTPAMSTPGTWRDGAWHKLEGEFRIADGGASDGICRLAWDDVKILDDSGFSDTDTPAGSVFSFVNLGRNTDVTGTDPERHWGPVFVWDADPGFSWL